MWLLDNKVIFRGEDTYVTLTFDKKYIGNRILSYVAYHGTIHQTLASLPLFILPNKKRGNIIYSYKSK
jgi:hypothetical protein